MTGDFDLRGGAAQIARLVEDGDKDPRGMLLEGGVSTSKTFPLQAVVHLDCLRTPGARWVLARRTRASMAETVLEEPWESDIIRPELESGFVRVEGGQQRRAYRYGNGSVVYPRGLDDIGKIMSGQFRGLLLHEVTPGPSSPQGVTEQDWQYLTTRVWRKGQGFLLLECNPSAPDHWANQWAEQGKLRRFLARHWCNPLYYTPEDLPDGRTRYHPTDAWRAYYANISQLVGPARERLLLHRWITAEGLCLPEWDPAIHSVSRARFAEIPKHRWRCAWLAQDWGSEAPGCLQLWMGTHDGEAYRVWEIMYRRKFSPWWAERVMELVRWVEKEYGLKPTTIECDHDDESIAVYNTALEQHGYPAVARRCEKGPGSIISGLDVMRQWMRPLGPDNPATRAYWVQDAEWCGRDASLREMGWSYGFEGQIGSYVWATHADGRPIPETPHPGCRDDAIDCSRYALTWAHRMRLHMPVSESERFKPDPGTWEYIKQQDREREQKPMGRWEGWGGGTRRGSGRLKR